MSKKLKLGSSDELEMLHLMEVNCTPEEIEQIDLCASAFVNNIGLSHKELVQLDQNLQIAFPLAYHAIERLRELARKSRKSGYQ